MKKSILTLVLLTSSLFAQEYLGNWKINSITGYGGKIDLSNDGMTLVVKDTKLLIGGELFAIIPSRHMNAGYIFYNGPNRAWHFFYQDKQGYILEYYDPQVKEGTFAPVVQIYRLERKTQ